MDQMLHIGGSDSAYAKGYAKMRLVECNVFWNSPPNTLTYGDSFYTRLTGCEKMRTHQMDTKGDIIDSYEYAFSEDNGKTWTALEQRSVYEPLPEGGALGRIILPGFVDPRNGRLFTVYNESVLPCDDAMEAMTRTILGYTVSLDGGRTNALDEMIVQEGYTSENPMRGVTVGKNAVMLGDKGCEPIRTIGGRLLVPVQVCPVGPDGNYINPGGGLSYHEAAVLIGRWSDDPADLHITWDLSPYISNDPAKSTRGALEPTIAQFPDGRILMVLRGSNGGTKDPDFRIPGHKWYTISHDEGDSWEPVRPWTYSDGMPFFSPSSMSQLLKHSNGDYYWIGNISPTNSRANSPRYPLVVGRVNPETLLLERDSVFVVDDRQPGEHEETMLSMIHAHEERGTGDILLHMSRWLTRGFSDLTGDASLYRISTES